QRLELAVDADRGVDAGGEVEVGTAQVDDPLQQVVDVQVAGLGLVAQPADDLRTGRWGRLLGDGDLDLVTRTPAFPARLARTGRPPVHRIDQAGHLVALGDGGQHMPASGLLDGLHGVGVARVGHGDHQLVAPSLD